MALSQVTRKNGRCKVLVRLAYKSVCQMRLGKRNWSQTQCLARRGLHAVQISNREFLFAIFPFVLQGTNPENVWGRSFAGKMAAMARVDSGAEAVQAGYCVSGLATFRYVSLYSFSDLSESRTAFISDCGDQEL